MDHDFSKDNFLENLEKIIRSRGHDQVSLNKTILNYYKKYGHSRDVEKYFLLETLQGKVGQPVDDIRKHMKTSAAKSAEMDEPCPSTSKTEDTRSRTSTANVECLKHVYQVPGDGLQIYEETENETDKSLEVCEPNMSTIKRMEWDSLGDVGYENDQKSSNTDLSTLERLAIIGKYRENESNFSIGAPAAESTPLENVNKQRKRIKTKKNPKSVLKKTTHTDPPNSTSIKYKREISFDVMLNDKVIRTVQKKSKTPIPESSSGCVTKSSSSFNSSKQITPSVPSKPNVSAKYVPKFKVKLGRKVRPNRRSASSNSSSHFSSKQSKSDTKLSRADSFEYMCGDKYNAAKTNDQSDHKSSNGATTTSSNAQMQDSDKSFARDLAQNLSMLKKIVEKRYQDADTRKRLVKKVVAKLIDKKYITDDSLSDFLSELTYDSQVRSQDVNKPTTESSSKSETASKSQVSSLESQQNNDSTPTTEDITNQNVNKRSFDEKSTSVNKSSMEKNSTENESATVPKRTTSKELFVQYVAALKYERNIVEKSENRSAQTKEKQDSVNHSSQNSCTSSKSNANGKQLKIAPALTSLETMYKESKTPLETPRSKHSLKKLDVPDSDLHMSKSVGDASILHTKASDLTSSPTDDNAHDVKRKYLIVPKQSEMNSECNLSEQTIKKSSFPNKEKLEESQSILQSTVHDFKSNTFPRIKQNEDDKTIKNDGELFMSLPSTSKKQIQFDSLLSSLDKRKTGFFPALRKNDKNILTCCVLNDETKPATSYKEPEPEKGTQTQVTIRPKKSQTTLADVNIYNSEQEIDKKLEQLPKPSVIEENKTDERSSSHQNTETLIDNSNVAAYCTHHFRNNYQYTNLTESVDHMNQQYQYQQNLHLEPINKAFSRPFKQSSKTAYECVKKNSKLGEPKTAQDLVKNLLSKDKPKCKIPKSVIEEIVSSKDISAKNKQMLTSSDEEANRDLLIELIKQISKKYKKDKKLNLDRGSTTSEKYVKLILESMQYLLGTDSDSEICMINSERSTDVKNVPKTSTQLESEKVEKMSEGRSGKLTDMNMSYDSHYGRIQEQNMETNSMDIGCSDQTNKEEPKQSEELSNKKVPSKETQDPSVNLSANQPLSMKETRESMNGNDDDKVIFTYRRPKTHQDVGEESKDANLRNSRELSSQTKIVHTDNQNYEHSPLMHDSVSLTALESTTDISLKSASGFKPEIYPKYSSNITPSQTLAGAQPHPENVCNYSGCPYWNTHHYNSYAQYAHNPNMQSWRTFRNGYCNAYCYTNSNHRNAQSRARASSLSPTARVTMSPNTAYVAPPNMLLVCQHCGKFVNNDVCRGAPKDIGTQKYLYSSNSGTSEPISNYANRIKKLRKKLDSHERGKRVAFTKDEYISYCQCSKSTVNFGGTEKEVACNTSDSCIQQMKAGGRARHLESRGREKRRPVPSSISYNLILESSDTLISKESKISKRKLKDVIVKVPSKTIPRSNFIDYNCNVFEKHKSDRSNSPPDATDNFNVGKYLKMNRPDFVENAKRRESYLKKTHRLRVLRQTAKRQLMNILNQESIDSVDSDVLRQLARDLCVQIPPRYFTEKKQPISEQEMKRHSNKIYQQLPEVQKKKSEKKKLDERNENIIMATLYNKMLQKRTLKGDINIPITKPIVRL